MNIDVIITIVMVIMLFAIVAVVIYSLHNDIESVDYKVDNVKKTYATLNQHNEDIDKSQKEDVVLHGLIESTNDKLSKVFDGNYDNLQNKPDLFDGEYDSLNGKPDLFDGNYNSLSDKPDLFNGEYDSLNGKPDLFDG
jgi:hypothetical protein